MSMIPSGRQSINRQDREAVEKTLRGNWLTQGPEITRFEECLAKYCSVSYALTTSSGTAALHLAYLAADIGKGDEVITTPNTFVATTNMLLAVGAKPVFIDIRADTYNLNEQLIERSITSHTKAIVPVHFAGHPCEMRTIHAIAKRHKLLVIEDACHALGALYKNKPVGGLGSAMTIFSFHPVKAITTGEGGMITIRHKKLYQKLVALRSHGIEKNTHGFNVMKSFGYNYRMTDIQASLGTSQLQRLNLFVEKRRVLARWYQELLGENKDLILPQELPGVKSSWHLFVIRTMQPKDRLPLYTYLQKAGVGVNFHYPPVYGHPYYRKHGFASFALPQAERYAETAITLPLYPDLKKPEVAFICAKIKEYFRTNAGH